MPSQIDPSGQVPYVPLTVDQANVPYQILQQQADTLTRSNALYAAKNAVADASSPRISLSDYLSTISDATLKQQLQTILSGFGSANAAQTLLDTILQNQSSVDYDQALIDYNSRLTLLQTQDNLQGKQQALNTAIATYNADPTLDNKTALDTATNNWNAAILSSGNANLQSLNSIRNSLGFPTLASLASYDSTGVTPPDLAPIFTYTLPTASEFSALVDDAAQISSIVHELQRQQISSNVDTQYQNTEKDLVYKPQRKGTTGGQGTSAIASSNVIAQVIGQVTFNEALESQKLLDAIFNKTGVPVGSVLIDQLASSIAPFIESVKVAAGITSAGPGSAVLKNGTFSQEGATSAIFLAAALGNLKTIHQLVSDPSFLQNIAARLNTSSEFLALPLAEQQKLIQGIAKAFAGNLIQEALFSLATALGAPGLTSQLLNQPAGTASGDPLASNQEQIVQTGLTAAVVAETLQVSQETANELLDNAAAAIQSANEVTQEAVAEAIAAQVTQSSAQQAATVQQLTAAATVEQTTLNDQLLELQLLKNEIFQNILEKTLIKSEYDPVQLALRNLPSSRDEIVALLVQQGVDENVAAAGVDKALRAAFPFDVNANPLAATGLNPSLSPSDLAAIFNKLIANRLTDVVGPAKAILVATEYEKQLELIREKLGQAVDGPILRDVLQKGDRRRHDDYESRTADIRNPAAAPWSPVHLGYTLLLLGYGVNPAEKGTESIGRYSGVAPQMPA